MTLSSRHDIVLCPPNMIPSGITTVCRGRVVYLEAELLPPEDQINIDVCSSSNSNLSLFTPFLLNYFFLNHILPTHL